MMSISPQPNMNAISPRSHRAFSRSFRDEFQGLSTAPKTSFRSDSVHFGASPKKPWPFWLKTLTSGLIALSIGGSATVPAGVISNNSERDSSSEPFRPDPDQLGTLIEELGLTKSEISCLSTPTGKIDSSLSFSPEIISTLQELQEVQPHHPKSDVQVVILETNTGDHAADVFNWLTDGSEMLDFEFLNPEIILSPDEDIKICAPTSRRPSNDPDDIVKIMGLFIQDTSDWIEALIQKKEAQQLPNLRLINMSLTFSRKIMYANIENQNSRRKLWEFEKGSLKEPEIIIQAEKRLKMGQEVKQALVRYQQVTCDAAKAGITLVVAAGNDEDKWPMATHPEASLNMFTMSDCVISVAASDPKDLSAEEQEDTLMPFSSWGTERWHPTISAPGPYGTSQSAPLATRVLKIALEKNPTLDFWQQKALLEQTATDTPAPKEGEGAGVINPVKLLKAVDKMAKSKTNKPTE